MSADELVSPHGKVDRIWEGDARRMDDVAGIADASVGLVVTSPPYFSGKAYEEALGEGHIPASYTEYLQMLEDVFAECARRLEPGGRIAVNVANLGRKPYRSLSADVISILQDRLGLLLRGEVVWWKAHAAGGSCAWGTYQRPGNPVLRDLTERVVIASKGRFDRALSPAERQRLGLPCEGSMFMDDFVDATTDVWDIPAESATRVGHPAPFPVELPRRLIELYTYRGDLVLDPFMGSGSTAVAAVRTERKFVGFDTDRDYVKQARRRVADERARLSAQGDGPRVVVPAVRAAEADAVGDYQVRATRQGRKAKELAVLAVAESGFADIEEDVTYPDLGVTVSLRARDSSGGLWLFDVSGAFSSTRPGLKRSDTLWKELGKAGVLRDARSAKPRRKDLGPLVLLTTDVPVRNSAGGRALQLSINAERGPIHDVIELRDPVGLARLSVYAHPSVKRR